jgi:hypothetical protein
MASSDYHLCAVCGGKAFYDVDIRDPHYVATYDQREAGNFKPIGILVLCDQCNETHTLSVAPKPVGGVGNGG